MINRTKLFRYIVGGLALLGAPFFLGGYFLYIATLTIVYTLASFGTNILSGYTNLLSLAGATFFGVGAYGTSILMPLFSISVKAWEPSISNWNDSFVGFNDSSTIDAEYNEKDAKFHI